MKKPEIITVEEGKLSHYIRMYRADGTPVHIPVIDVTDGIAERMLGESIIKASQRSKWINYNQYHVSKKPIKQL
jgi:hypothetical protein